MANRKDSTTTMQPTPGPWTARANMSGVTIVNPDGIAVARTPCCDRQAVADGALLAAAPDLLAALKDLANLAYNLDIGPDYAAARRAIAKAEGQQS